jgi:hypothetical protein
LYIETIRTNINTKSTNPVDVEIQIKIQRSKKYLIRIKILKDKQKVLSYLFKDGEKRKN